MTRHIVMTCAAAALLCVLSGCSSALQDTADPAFKERYGAYDYCGIKAVRQTEKNSCGAACLASVADYWGVDVTESQILAAYPKAPKRGYTLLELKAISICNGLDAYMLSMADDPLTQLREQLSKGRPLICAVSLPQLRYFAYDVPVYNLLSQTMVWSIGPRLNHYIVVFGMDAEDILVMDPVRGFVRLSHKRFESAWSEKKYAVLVCGGKKEGGIEDLPCP
ncbi:MAG: cysteine peptidase family C39 domain-containing protein [Planctomycetota bacterium]